jgi:hypothetical protein
VAKKGRFISPDPTPANLIALWNKIHDATDGLAAANATIAQQAATIASLQTGLTQAQRNALQALISAGKTTTQQSNTSGQSGGSGGSGGGGGSPPPQPVPPPGGGTAAGTPLNPALPAWLYNALVAAGQPTTSNLLNEALLGDPAVEATCNANDFTVQRNSGCATRARLYHQGNHGLWGTFCGQPDASAVADYFVNVSISYADGSQGWGWV